MEKYMSAAETISRRAIGADPLPAKPLERGQTADDDLRQVPTPDEPRFTFDFGGGGVKSQGPRFGLRLGLQGDSSPGEPEPDPFISAMSLRFALDGPAEASLGGLTVPLGFGLSAEDEEDATEDDGAVIDYSAAAQLQEPLMPDRGVPSAAEPTKGWSLEASVTPSAGTAKPPPSDLGRWRFRPIAAEPAQANASPATKVVTFSLKPHRFAVTAATVAVRGAWRFRAQEAGAASSKTLSFKPIAELLLRHLIGAKGAPKRDTGEQTVQANRRHDAPQQGKGQLQPPHSDRWVFRQVAEHKPGTREMTSATFDGNGTRLKRRHLPIR